MTGLFLVVLVALIAYLVWRTSQRGRAVAGRDAPAGVLRPPQRTDALADAEAEARRWVERLGAGVYALDGPAGPAEPAARQALADAAERHAAAVGQLARAGTVQQFQLVDATALEGLYYIRAARTALGLDPGPELPGADQHRSTGGRVELAGAVHEGTAAPTADNRYWFPGGRYQGRPLPGGWYPTPWWQTALLGGAGAFGGMLLADALFDSRTPGFGGMYGDGIGSGFDTGYDQGYDAGFDQGQDRADDGGGFADGGGYTDGGGYDDPGAGGGFDDGGSWDV